jgi:pimeloyl-ACP methyl ester carboxylesterase
MGKLDGVFDRSGAVFRPPRRWLLREFASLVTAQGPWAEPVRVDPGRGETVLVIPPFLTPDLLMAPFRDALTRCGHVVEGWGLGPNFGPTPRLLGGLRRKLADMAQRRGGPVTVIGVSLGGLMARDLALDRPADVRQVITIASPFRLPTAATIEPLFHLVAHRYVDGFDFRRLQGPLPMPSLAIYTREDGIVSWESCVSDEPLGVNVEVAGRHMVICRYPQVIRAVTARLAQP